MKWALLIFVFTVGQREQVPPFFVQSSTKMMTYYQSPDPSYGPAFLKELVKPENAGSAWFADKSHVQMMMGYQLGDIAVGNSKIVRQYEEMFSTSNEIGKRIIVCALWNCGDDPTIKLVEQWSAEGENSSLKADLEALKKHLADKNRKHVRNQPASTPDALDFLWINFFTTGEYEPVSRILDVLDQPTDGNTLVLQQAARWSLKSNLQQHPWLVKIVRDHVSERPAATKNLLGEILAKHPQDDATKAKLALLELRSRVVGKWIADGETIPSLEIFANGNIRIAHPVDNKWWIGTYTISDKGRVTSRSTLDGATLTSYWTLESDTLVAPRGPNPRVVWTKVPKSDAK